jgi:5-methylcytosine-specific restriction endonuclease McrA
MSGTVFSQIKAIAKKHGVECEIKPNNHVQVRGSILVNWYPLSRKQTMYVAGTTQGVERATPTQVIEAAIGKRLPQIRTVKRKKDYSRVKRWLWDRRPFCHWCGAGLTVEQGTVDHVIPLSKGGLNSRNNYVLACQPCNNKRAADIPKLVRA